MPHFYWSSQCGKIHHRPSATPSVSLFKQHGVNPGFTQLQFADLKVQQILKFSDLRNMLASPKKGEKNMLVSWPQSPLPDSQDPQRMDLLEDLGAPGMPRSRDRSWPYLTKLQCFPASRSMATLRHGGVRGVEPSNIGNLSIKHIDLTWVNHQESRSSNMGMN